VPSKIVKILEVIGRVTGIPVRPPIGSCRAGYPCVFRPRSHRYADKPVQGFPFIRLFNGAPNLVGSSEEILCGELAKR
jgi:hypothetical protein